MLKSLIQGLRLYSLLLFLIPTIAILVSLFLNNHLSKYNSSTYLKGKIESFVMECNLGNGYCLDTLITTELHKCSKFTISKNYYIDGELFGIENKLVHILMEAEGIVIGLPESKTIGLISADQLKLLGEKNKIEIKSLINKDEIDDSCIKNSVLYPIYKHSSFMRKLYVKLSSKFVPATSTIVVPFIDGKTSISNIVKRYPINYFFKPLLYLSSLLMILYWIRYKKIFSGIEEANNTKKIEFFLIFGILSSIFLFLHVFFLGFDIDNSMLNIDSSMLKKFRRLIIILFILFELIAQFFLVRKIFAIKDILFHYTYKIIIYMKLVFITIIISLTVIVVAILIFFEPSNTFNYILEWNYFLFLVIFYLLSAVMWRKNKKNTT